VRPVTSGHQISVAIHGQHFVRGIAYNIHNLNFDREKESALPPCPQDEQAVLNELESTLRTPAADEAHAKKS
jgi:hypothetical protein